MFAGLLRNVSAGTRLAFFLPLRWLDFRASGAQFALLIAFNLTVWIVSSTLRDASSLQNPLFNATAIAIYLAQVPLLLLACLLIAAIYANASLAILLAVALSASDLAFELVGLAIAAAGQTPIVQAVGFIAYLAWAWIVSLRAIAVCVGTRRPQFLYASGVVTVLIATAVFVLPRAELWIPAPAAAPPGLAQEQAFHAQGELIERELAAIEPGRDGVPELFFVGFAPDGSQDVFLREMRSVRQIMDSRFGTRGRSIALISSEAALAEYPVATATNLRRTLKQVAARMNADEDVLFLYISAHGDARFELSAHAPPLELARVNPTVLARALSDAGIKWRVLVISACYSAGFIEPLKDANTLIVTAAAADRQSFGCRNGNDWTYFGEAYFAQALGRTRSFVEAFAFAAEAVTAREAAEKLTPSFPQMFVGGAIGEKLRQLPAPPGG